MQKYLQNGATEIARQLQRLDIIANNLANMNTTGYKAQDIAFCDLINQKTKGSLTESVAKVARTSRDFSQGVIAKCDNPFSIAIYGKGFFRVLDEDGNEYYTRDGNFLRDAQGRLVNPSGHFLQGIKIPDNSKKVYIRSNGAIDSQDFQGEITRVGQIKLYTFKNPQELKAIGGNLFTANSLSGDPQEFNPGGEGLAELKQGFLETSNTGWAMEMMKLIQTQRTIQMNSQSVTKVADQLWEMANNLRR